MNKKGQIASIICGTILMVISAVFALSLAVSFLSFGKQIDSITYIFGNFLINAYGFSSIIIPVYFFVVGIFCFSTRFTIAKRTFAIVSIIPFITITFTEKILIGFIKSCETGADIVKIVILCVISILLVVTEYLLGGIIISKIVTKKFMKAKEELLAKQNGNDEVKEEVVSPEEIENDNSTKYNWSLDENGNREEDYQDDSFPLREVEDSDDSYDYDEEDPIASFESTTVGYNDDISEMEEYNRNEVVENNDDFNFEINFDDESIDDIYEVEDVELNDYNESDENDYESEDEVVLDKKSVNNVFSKMNADILENFSEDELEGMDEIEDSDEDYSENTEKHIVTSFELAQKRHRAGKYQISTELLNQYAENPYWIVDEETKQAAQNLKETLNEFRIEAEVTGIKKGPVVTMFEILPAPGVKLSKIVALGDNIALRLAAQSVRIVAPIPGKRAVGIEIPNAKRAIVSFRECIEQERQEWKKMAVPVILGKDIQGDFQIMDLVKTPHLLIAGSTGAGKSVCVNSMILSILYKRSPDEVKMILIDPKIVELKLYNGIPHLLTPVITEPKKAMQALQYCLCEMERRYAVLDSMGCRDISSYNKKITEKKIATEKLPYIVVIIDEFADLMATTGKQLESVVARLAAMSRAVGIHLVLATQRPSIDVITGLIKANIPSRIAFMVASKMDSRIIIDQVGADKLLGKGDMLYASATDPFPVRIQGAFISDGEVENVVSAVKEWGEPEYIDEEIFVDDDDDETSQISLFNDGADDPLYEKALDIVIQAGKASASYIQRKLSIGYNRAARLVELMEERGIVGPANGSKPREIIHIP